MISDKLMKQILRQYPRTKNKTGCQDLLFIISFSFDFFSDRCFSRWLPTSTCVLVVCQYAHSWSENRK